MEKRLISILRLAIKHQASDIHLTLKGHEMIIEMRINDKMAKIKTQKGDNRLIRYLQYLANLDVGRILVPQTGQFEMVVDGTMLSLRFALINNYNFSNGVLRILNSSLKINPKRLSVYQFQNEMLARMMKEPYGLILFSGPTGSGKTTTMYSLLNDVANSKIYTIEDPIEVYSEKYVQLQVNEAIGLDYASGVRQILRHDPDIIMIGEIRDEKAAKMAVVAANTGHLVLSTIHSSTSASVITRMNELGVNEQHLREMLICSINQRMIQTKTGHKLVIYEMMDQEEIAYYHQNQCHSASFLSIEKQLDILRKDGLIDE